MSNKTSKKKNCTYVCSMMFSFGFFGAYGDAQGTKTAASHTHDFGYKKCETLVIKGTCPWMMPGSSCCMLLYMICKRPLTTTYPYIRSWSYTSYEPPLSPCEQYSTNLTFDGSTLAQGRCRCQCHTP